MTSGARRDREQTPERIDPPSARPQIRTPKTFNAPARWAIALIVAGLIYLGAALLFQNEYNQNTTIVFGEITEQAEMPWYYDHPWLGALVLAGLPALAFAFVFVNLMENRFMVRELRTQVSDLSLNLQHTGYRLQGQLDQIASRLPENSDHS